MLQKTVCKFRCESVTPDESNPNRQTVKLRTEYDNALSQEDAAFSKATPSGSFEAVIDNPAVKGFFEQGKGYYLTVTPTGD